MNKKTIIMSMAVLLIIITGASAYTQGSTLLSMSLLNQDPDPAIAGEVVEVRLGIDNTGGKTAENVIISPELQYPFQLAPGEEAEKNIGSIGGYKESENSQVIKYKIMIDRSATAGTYNLKINYKEQSSNAGMVSTFPIAIKNKESAEVIYIDKTLLVPGKQEKLKFVINNVGNAPLKDLSFKWVNADKIILPVGSDNTRYISYIDVEESAELVYDVIADTNAEPGLYVLDLTLSYTDQASGADKEINTIAGVYVGGNTDFDVSFSESSNGETSFSVANVGSNPAFSVSISIPQQENWRVTGSNSVIIGNLNKGDYTVASFTLSGAMNGMPNRNLTGTNNKLRINIDYTNTMGERQSVEKTITLNPQTMMTTTTGTTGTMTFRGRTTQQSFWTKYKWYIIFLIVAGASGFGYWKYKKEKASNPGFKLKDLLSRKKRR